MPPPAGMGRRNALSNGRPRSTPRSSGGTTPMLRGPWGSWRAWLAGAKAASGPLPSDRGRGGTPMGRNQHGKGIGAPRGEGATQREERFKTRRTSSRPRAERLGRRRLDALRALPDYLAPGLDIVFVGINPGARSARTGHYYGNPRNPFWRLLHEAGLTPRRLRPEEDHLLPAFGIGITDIVKRPSRGVGDLAGTEFRRGRAALEAKLLRVRPRIVCFNSKTGFVPFFGPRAFRRFGRQAVRIGP